MSSTTVIWPLERRDHSVIDGVLTFYKRSDEIRKVILDWSDEPPIRVSASTISSVAYEDHGTTRTSVANTTTTSTCFVTGTGYFKVTVTFANNEKIQRIVRFVSIDDNPDQSDYRY